MSTTNQDWSVRGPISTRGNVCAVQWGCIGVTARTDVVGTKTFTYCGLGPKRRLLSVTDPQPVPSTGTINGPEEDLRQTLGDFMSARCPTWFQLYSCDGDIKHFSGVYLGDRSAVNPQTANQPNATGAALIDDIAFQYDRIVFIRRPAHTDMGTYVNNTGYHEEEAVIGVVDGVRTQFRLSWLPLDEYPVFIYVNDVLEPGANYTIDGRNITFLVAPACGDVITATYYDERYAVYGLCPLRVVFCSEPCSDRGECEECTTAYALYETTIPADVDTCEISEGMRAAIVRYQFDDGIVTFDSLDLRDEIVNPYDMVCDGQGNLVVAAESGFYEGCNEDFSLVRNMHIPTNIRIRRLAADLVTGRVYGLYGDSGIMARDLTGRWYVMLEDGQLTADYQNDIAAANHTIVTGGVGNSIQIGERNNGQVMELKDGPETEDYDILAVGLGPTPINTDRRALLYTLSTDNVQTYLHLSHDFGDTWSFPRKTWNFVPVEQPTIHTFEDWLVFVQIGDQTWRNTNRGCDKCNAWELLLDSGYDCSKLAICPEDPNSVFIVQQPLQAAVPDFQFLSDELATEATVNVLLNDYSVDDPLDPATLAIVSNSQVAAMTATVVANQIELEMIGVPTAPQAYIVYTVETIGGTVLTGLLVVTFLA